MDKEIIAKSKVQIKNKWFKTKEDELDMALNIIDELEQQCKKQKEVISRATEYIKERFYFNEETGEYSLLHTFDKCNAKELLDILKEMSE